MSYYISRTPHRVSFFGGGTDISSYYNQYPSFVIAAGINQYSYISCRPLANFNNYKSRIIYSQVEEINDNYDIQHNIIRNVLQTLQINYGIEIIHSADIPSGGTGSSASFTVGLFNVLQAMEGRFTSAKGLAESAILVENGLLKELTGIQDAYTAAYGGLNIISAHKDNIEVLPLICSSNFINELENSCLLIDTGVKRKQKNVSTECFKNIDINVDKLHNVMEIANLGLKAFRNEDIIQIGKLINEAWEIKRKLSPVVSNQTIDELCSYIKFLGGYPRLIGSGGGGFILTVFPKELKNKFIDTFKNNIKIPLKISYQGSSIIYAGKN